jgi:basic membrane protein A and related proteins
MTKKFTIVFAVLMVASLLLGACAPKAAPAETKFRVGLVTDVGKVDDKSFNQSAWEGVQKAAAELNAEAQYVETGDSKDYAKNIATFADEGYNVIVTVGFGLGEATIEAAKKYPKIMFIGVDQFQTDTLANLTGLNFPEDNAGFLVGALAASISKSGKLGAVCGTDAVPPVWRFGEGYRNGAAYINPDVEVTVVYHSDVGFDKTFSDPEWGKTTAVSMIDKGVDVVFGAGGKTGNGALLAAAEKSTPEKPVYAIGVDSDQYYTVPEAQKVLVSSAFKLITPGVSDLIKLASEGKFPGGNYFGDAGYAPFHDLESAVPAEVKAKLDEIAKGLKDGSIKTNVAPAKPAE